MIDVILYGQRVVLPDPRSHVDAIVDSPTGRCTSTDVHGTRRYDLVPAVVTRTARATRLDAGRWRIEVAAAPRLEDYELGALVLGDEEMELVELPEVHDEDQLRAHILATHPEACGHPEALLLSVYPRCRVWRLDYGTLEYEPGNTYDFVLPTGGLVGAFALGPTGYLDMRWLDLSLPVEER